MSEENTSETTPVEQNNRQELPDWARKEISDANSEAAKYRKKAQTAAEEAKAEVTASFNDQFKALSDEKSAVLAERDTASSQYNKLVAALQAGVPGDTALEFAPLLQGSNVDEYKAHAEKLKGMFGPGTKQKAVDRTAGFSGDTQSTPEDVFADIFKRNLTQK